MVFIAFNQEFLVTVSTNSLNFQKSIGGGVWTTERLSKVCSRKTRFNQLIQHLKHGQSLRSEIIILHQFMCKIKI